MKTLPITGNNNIFIIDECQQLTPAAKSLLLKPCEDTGDFNYVFFCTTNPDKFFKGREGFCTHHASYTVEGGTAQQAGRHEVGGRGRHEGRH